MDFNRSIDLSTRIASITDPILRGIALGIKDILDKGDTFDAPEALYPFPEGIIIKGREAAARDARLIFDSGSIDRCLIIWTDASTNPRQAGTDVTVSAIRYRDLQTHGWMELVTLNSLTHSSGSARSELGEFIAVHEAFRVACQRSDTFDKLIILTDCQTVLRKIRSNQKCFYHPKHHWRDNLLKWANELHDLGIAVELRWVPGHAGLQGNERVDKLARKFRIAAERIVNHGGAGQALSKGQRNARNMSVERPPRFQLDNVSLDPHDTKSVMKALFLRINHGRGSNVT